MSDDGYRAALKALDMARLFIKQYDYPASIAERCRSDHYKDFDRAEEWLRRQHNKEG